MISIRWLPKAKDDLQRLYDFIEKHNPDAAARAVNTLVDAADALIEFPEKGRPWEEMDGFRELFVTFGARGYVIRYRIDEDHIVIVRVWHSLEQRT